jgi:hypothetical protein
MNYLTAMQRKVSGRWDFTCRNGLNLYPIGYCVPWERVQKAHAFYSNALDESNKDKYHEDGHATKDAACECYRQYLLDNMLRFHQAVGQHMECCVCGDLTLLRASIHKSWPLCDEHRTREIVATLCPAVDTIWES